MFLKSLTPIRTCCWWLAASPPPPHVSAAFVTHQILPGVSMLKISMTNNQRFPIFSAWTQTYILRVTKTNCPRSPGTSGLYQFLAKPPIISGLAFQIFCERGATSTWFAWTEGVWSSWTNKKFQLLAKLVMMLGYLWSDLGLEWWRNGIWKAKNGRRFFLPEQN